MNWVNVQDKLPDENGGYLTVQIYHGIKVVDTAHFWRFGQKHQRCGQTEWTVDYGCEHEPNHQAITVTHWMPLPSAPAA